MIHPIDFNNYSNPTLIFEYASNDNLERMMEVNKRKKGKPVLDETKKLILLFGIAEAMSYLHSINIIHCRLSPSSILLDDFLFPKITGLDYSKNLIENPIIPLSDLVEGEYSMYEDYDIYNAPELMNCYTFSSACDVYSFAVITYELITDENPFQDGRSDEGYRPVFKETIPNCYKQLIEKCWDQDPKKRPTFEEIVNHMKTNQEFITENVDKEEFLNYIKFTEEIREKSINNEIFELDNYIQTQNERFRKIKINYNKLRDWLRINLTVNIGASDLSKYSKQKKLGNGSFGNVYKILDKQNDIVYAAKISIYEMDQCSEDTIMNLSREIDIISSIKYPSILQFIGFCPKNFKGKPKPVIITELATNGSLEDILENERKGFANHDWNDTKKLINIYGIASGMQYLDNRDLLHRDLKPANILLDENLYPKIADFGMSKNSNEVSKGKKHIISGFKGTYAYAAPEVIEKYDYSTYGDVYSFAMIMFEIMTNEKPFDNIKNIYQLLLFIKQGRRPKFNVSIPYCYKNLIQKCWNEDPYSRPQFSKICSILENDPNFITPNVDKDEYLNYINYLNESQNENNNIEYKENKRTETIKTKNTTISTNLERIEEEKVVEEENESKCFLDLNKYHIEEVIFKKDAFKICKVRDIETNNEFAAYMSMLKVNPITNDEIKKLSDDLIIIRKLNHPSLLKFIGFSLIDFKKQRKPVIITELATNGVLEQILELEKMNKKINGWDSTKKLINIYGIASSMAYMHSYGIIHRNLNPSNIYLDDILCPKIGEFGLLARFTDTNNMTHQSMSGAKGTPIYSAPEVLEFNTYTESSDVYSFSLVVYELLTNDKPFSEINNISQIYNKIVVKGERPAIKKEIPEKFKKLIEQCWSQDPSLRPKFKDIVYFLKMDNEFITDEINKEDYEKYINFIDSKIININDQKIEENNLDETSKSNSKINENSNDEKRADFYIEKDNNINFIDENLDEINIPTEINTKNSDILELINEYIKSNNVFSFMNFLNNECDDETASLAFDRCYYESHELFINLCKEGFLSNNAIAHHKYAISLILDSKNTESKDDHKMQYKKACEHLKESIKLGYNASYFSLSLLYFDIFKDKEKAYKTAQEGASKNEKYSICLFGYFIAHGIGTNKDFNKGVSIILSSNACDFYENFATDIGIYYHSQLNKDENEIFKWFEKAFFRMKTKATINNYAICFIEGIGVDKNIEKAKEIFKIGVDKNDSNSLYYYGLLLEDTDQKESLKYYKLSADQGDPRSQFIIAKSLEEKDQLLSLQYFIKAAEGKNIKAQEFLAVKYAKENDTENALKYIFILINEGCFEVPLNYAVTLYKLKQFKQAFNIFSLISKFNHPIAKYFIGIMKYNGEGCTKSKKEAHEILLNLSDHGIEKATDFLDNFDF
ncbi:hypothetical protein M9Y10_034032 [Tritrichomonas musculus]|uniref:Protein kinase domain-containing protein n=1 Tax=Tritrichomonas musculus TaxID=1915356 RepID=A0ABR2KDT8_9EUKA